jgi:hypothetical protein
VRPRAALAPARDGTNPASTPVSRMVRAVGLMFTWVMKLRAHIPKPFLLPLYFLEARLIMSRIRSRVRYDTPISGRISTSGTRLSPRRVLYSRCR